MTYEINVYIINNVRGRFMLCVADSGDGGGCFVITTDS